MGTFGILALVLSAIAAISGGVLSYNATQKANQFNQSQYEDWKAYNSPANQMQRLSEGGLSPYMVNGVSNTLSQPFSVGANQGIAEMLGGLSQSMQQAGQYVENLGIKKDANAIKKDSVQIQRDKLELEKEFTQLRKDMFQTNINKGKIASALMWWSADNKKLVSEFLKRTMPYRVGSTYYDYLSKQQAYSFNELMNPQVLEFYTPTQRAKINNMNANTHYLRFREDFAMQQLLQDMVKFNARQSFDEKWNWLNFNQRNDFFNSRLGLSSQYYDLAYKKWLSDMVYRGIGAYQNQRGQSLNFLGKFVPFIK